MLESACKALKCCSPACIKSWLSGFFGVLPRPFPCVAEQIMVKKFPCVVYSSSPGETFYCFFLRFNNSWCRAFRGLYFSTLHSIISRQNYRTKELEGTLEVFWSRPYNILDKWLSNLLSETSSDRHPHPLKSSCCTGQMSILSGNFTFVLGVQLLFLFPSVANLDVALDQPKPVS